MIDLIFQLLVLGIIITGCVSFTLFIRRLLVNAAYRNEKLNNIEQKLDAIMEKMEQDSFSK
ncbi:DUF4083 domain-containing protein [Sutcliffiella deserti]|uniref:DUF4083 domain-containing protein n=1 Tax=Sutcliffiella deserti TaxID=2875501 RepID=UPI001CBF5AB8|nr:DUF4083 domain-containing protein [Sutcliffiella deserti]